MTYKEFIDFVKSKCTYETLYEDGEGRLILVIDLLSAYVMVNKAKQEWVSLTRDEQSFVYDSLHNATSRKDSFWVDFANAIEAQLKTKNT
jgi:hypothetical protein